MRRRGISDLERNVKQVIEKITLVGLFNFHRFQDCDVDYFIVRRSVKLSSLTLIQQVLRARIIIRSSFDYVRNLRASSRSMKYPCFSSKD